MKVHLAVGLFAMLSLPALAPCAEAPMDFKVLCWNIRNSVDSRNWRERKPTVFRVLADEKPDFICMQEAYAKQIVQPVVVLRQDHGLNYGWIGVGRPKDGPAQQEKIRKAVAENDRENDNEKGGEHCPILWNSDRWDLVRGGTVWLHPDEEKRNTPGAKHPKAADRRIYTWGEFRLKTSGSRILVVNTHLDKNSSPRIDAARQLVTEVSALAGDLPVVLVGDMNAGPTANEIGLLQGAFRKVCSNAPTFHDGRGPGHKKNEKLDYIFLRGDAIKNTAGFELVTNEIRVNKKLWASDHFPLVSPLQLVK